MRPLWFTLTLNLPLRSAFSRFISEAEDQFDQIPNKFFFSLSENHIPSPVSGISKTISTPVFEPSWLLFCWFLWLNAGNAVRILINISQNLWQALSWTVYEDADGKICCDTILWCEIIGVWANSSTPNDLCTGNSNSKSCCNPNLWEKLIEANSNSFAWICAWDPP